MNINGISPSFGSIQVATSKMNRKQMDVSDKFCNAVKYNDEYQSLAEEDVDIYILPGKGGSQIDVRVMDPYSGNFVRYDRSIINRKLSNRSSNDEVINAANDIIQLVKSVARGIVKRPAVKLMNIFEGKTAMSQLNPDKYKQFDRDLQYWLDNEIDFDEALHMAYDNFVDMYHIGNIDADF